MNEVEIGPANFFGDELLSRLALQLAEMEPGTKLPSEREQALELGVSRTALRDRLSRLESMGVLERRTGSGTYVRGMTPENVSESILLGLVSSKMSLSSLQSVRFALERQAAFEAAQTTDHIALARMFVALDKMDASNDTEDLHAADVEFHKSLFAASKSPGLIFFAKVLHDVLDPRQKLVLSDDKVELRRIHRNIADAVAEKDPELAMRAIDGHFNWLSLLQRKYDGSDHEVLRFI